MSSVSKLGNRLFRQAALARLASPDQLDMRLEIVALRPWMLASLPLVLLTMTAYFAWLLASTDHSRLFQPVMTLTGADSGWLSTAQVPDAGVDSDANRCRELI